MNTLKKLLAVGAAGLLATLGVGATSPVAQAQECAPGSRMVQSGSLQWGLKESFRDYITSRIAQGYYEVSHGASDLGSAFDFPVTGSTIISDSQAEIDLDGRLYFYGHSGALDITLDDFGLNINGSQAEITVDYRSHEFAGYTPGVQGDVITGDDVVLAVIDLDQPANFSRDQVSLAGSTTMGQGGRELFGDFYAPNQEFDRTAGQLLIADGCGNPASPRSGGGAGGGANRGATDSGATEGAAALLGQINDTLIEVNGLFVNTENVLDNGQRLYNRSTGQGAPASTASGTTSRSTSTNASGGTTQRSGGAAPSGGSTSGGSAPAPSANAPRGGGASGGNTSGGSTSGGGQGSAPAVSASSGQSGDRQASASTPAPAGASVSDNICTAADAVGVQSAQAQWGIRESFRNYIRGSIANGGWNLGGVSYNGTAFEFTGSTGSVSPSNNEGTILFPGTINFYGHNGILDTTFANMEIQFSGNSGQIIVDASSNDVDGNPHQYGRVALADLHFTQLDVSSSHVSASATTTLTAAGAEAFGQFYPVGDPLDPITFSASLGGAPNCATGQGQSGAPASATGSGTSANRAAALRAGGGSSRPGSSANAAESDATTNDPGISVDDIIPVEESSSPVNDRADQFRVLGNGNNPGGGSDLTRDEMLASLLLTLASLGVAGASLIRYTRSIA